MSSNRILADSISTADIERPFGLAFDAARNRLLIADGASHSVVYADATASSPSTSTLGGYGTDPTTEGLFVPMDIAVNGGGDLIVLDAGNGELDRYGYDPSSDSYSYDGGFLGGSRDTLAGTTLSDPTALAGRGTDCYVLDTGNDRVTKLDRSSGSATDIVTGGGWKNPSGLAVDSTGTVYVADTAADVVTVHNRSGGPLGGTGSADGEFRDPTGLAVDGADHLFVVDDGNRRVQEFDASGSHATAFGGPGDFGSGHGIALGSGSVYVADLTRGAVHKYVPSSGDPRARIGASTLDFGDLEVGYTLRASVDVHNDGGSPLSVKNVTANGAAFDARTGSVTVPPDESRQIEVAFSPTETETVTGELVVTHDGAGVGRSSLVLIGRGVEPTTLEAALVLDRSGSMRQSAGKQSKMAALHQAASTFAELMRAGTGDKLAIVGFDDDASVAHRLREVTESPTNTRQAAKNAIRSLSPGATTSIGDGIVTARGQFGKADDDVRQVMVVVSDGMENESPYVLPEQNQQGVTLSNFEGFEIHTVGLGLGTEVDLTVLSKLASFTAGDRETTGGSFHLTEQRWLRLQKFFVEIFGDAMDEYVALDPEYRLNGGEQVETDVTLDDIDLTATFAVYWEDPGAAVEARVRTPAGTTVDPAFARSHDGIRHGGTATSEFYRVDLPLAAAGDAHTGTWTVETTNQSHRNRQTTVGVSVLVGSDLGVDCAVHRDANATGLPARLDVRLTEAGNPVAPDAVEFAVERPAYSRGELYAELLSGDGGPEADPIDPAGPDGRGDETDRSEGVTDPDPDRRVDEPDGDDTKGAGGGTGTDPGALSTTPLEDPWLSGIDGLTDESDDVGDWLFERMFDQLGPDAGPPEDYASAPLREALAEAVESDPRFAERTVERLDGEVLDGDEPTARVDLDPLKAEGSYHVRAVLEYERNGRTLRRECRRTLAAVSRPSAARTTAEVVESEVEEPIETLHVQVTPRDQEDNLLGPTLADEIELFVDRGSIGEITDTRDGRYRFPVEVPVESARREAPLERVDDLGEAAAAVLRDAGFDTLSAVRGTDPSRIEAVDEIDPGVAERVRRVAALAAGPPTVSMSLRGVTIEWPLPALRVGVPRREPTGPQLSPGEAEERGPPFDG